MLTADQLNHIMSRPTADGHSQVMAQLAGEVLEKRARVTLLEELLRDADEYLHPVLHNRYRERIAAAGRCVVIWVLWHREWACYRRRCRR